MEEIWRDIKGYEGKYQVSNLGRVKSLERTDNNNHKVKEKELKIISDKDQYSIINLYQNGKNKTCRIHRLVASAFIPNPNNYPVINHKDENRTNNRIDNLEWCTSKHNNNYGSHNKKVGKALKGKPKSKQHILKVRENNPNKRKVKCLNTNEIFEYIVDAARIYNICQSDITKCCKGKNKSAGKIDGKPARWMYYEDYLKLK